MSERDDAMGDGSAEDLAAILLDDEFVESILRGGDVAASSDDERLLAALFAGARNEVLSAPMPDMPSDDQLAAALSEGIGAAGGATVTPLRRTARRRWMTTVTAGAASVAVLLGGIAVAGHYFGADAPAGQSSQEVVTAASIRQDLDRASDLLAKGDREACLAVLDTTAKKLERLRGDASFEALDDQRVELWSKATGKPKSEAPAVGAERTTEPAPTTTTTTVPAPTTAPDSSAAAVPPVVTATVAPEPTATNPAPPPATTAPPPPPATSAPEPTSAPPPPPTTEKPTSAPESPPETTAAPTPTPDPQVLQKQQQLSDLDGD